MPYPAPLSGLYFIDGANGAIGVYRTAYDAIQQFGAKGTGTDDDAQPLLRGLLQAAAKGIPLYLPPTNLRGDRAIYATSQTLPLQPGQILLGDATGPTTGSLLRALAPMRSVLSIQSTVQLQPFSPQPVHVHGVSVDSAGLAQFSLNQIGAWFSRLTNVFALGAIYDNLHNQAHALPLLIGPVTGPAPITVTQRDPGYIGGLVSGTIAHKCVVGGPLGTAQFVSSYDGGATFATVTQGFYALTNICVTSGSTYQYDSGIQIAWPARTYAVNEVWSYAVTVQTEPGGNPNAINVETVFHDCWGQKCGGAAASAGLYGRYASLIFNTLLAGGTASTTNGQQLITGSGTSWMSSGGRPGDSFIFSGATLASPIACIMDDTHIIAQQGAAPAATAGSADWAIGYGANWWQDDGGDSARCSIIGGRFDTAPTNIRAAGDTSGGLYAERVRMENHAFSGVSVGGLQQSEKDYMLNCCEFKTSIANSHAIYLSSKAAGGIILNPRQNTADIVGPGAPYVLVSGGTFSQH